MIEALGTVQWSFEQFIIRWVADVDVRGSTKYASQLKRRRMLMQMFAQLVTEGDIPMPIMPVINKEIKSLVGKPFFGRYDPDKEGGTELDSVDFSGARAIIEKHAPTYLTLMEVLMTHKRGHRPSYAHDADRDSRIYTVTALICRSKNLQLSCFFAKIMDSYLHAAGAKRAVIDVLSSVGVCNSYVTGVRMLPRLEQMAKVGRVYSLDPKRSLC